MNHIEDGGKLGKRGNAYWKTSRLWRTGPSTSETVPSEQNGKSVTDKRKCDSKANVHCKVGRKDVANSFANDL